MPLCVKTTPLLKHSASTWPTWHAHLFVDVGTGRIPRSLSKKINLWLTIRLSAFTVRCRPLSSKTPAHSTGAYKPIPPHLHLEFCKHFPSSCCQTFCNAGKDSDDLLYSLQRERGPFLLSFLLLLHSLSHLARVRQHSHNQPIEHLPVAHRVAFKATLIFIYPTPKHASFLTSASRPPLPPLITLSNCSCRHPHDFQTTSFCVFVFNGC